jgi:hypothetical protein
MFARMIKTGSYNNVGFIIDGNNTTLGIEGFVSVKENITNGRAAGKNGRHPVNLVPMVDGNINQLGYVMPIITGHGANSESHYLYTADGRVAGYTK